MNNQDTTLAFRESQAARHRAAEVNYRGLMERLFAVISSKNSLAPDRVTPAALGVQLQAMLAINDVAALVDTMVEMGRLDRLDFIVRATKRLEQMISSIERG